MSKIAESENISFQTLVEGMMRVRDNAASLLADAEILHQNGRICRSYTLAYMACEEAGKLSILVGAAIQVVLSIPVDWNTFRKRFRSHDSKAAQFAGLANAIPIILEAVAAGQKRVDGEALMAKAAAGVLVGPALFTQRNASIYCDLLKNSFTSPSEVITQEMADRMLQWAKNHLYAANAILGKSVQEAATNIRKADRRRYDAIMSRASESAELFSLHSKSKRPESETGV